MKVLVTAETNTAVDNITRKLRESINPPSIIRLGNINSGLISKDLYNITLDGQIEMTSLKQGKLKNHSVSYRDEKICMKLLHTAQVICTTCAGAGDPLLKRFTFPFVVFNKLIV